MRLVLMLAALVLALFAATAAAGPTSAETAKPVLRYGEVWDLANLNPAKGIAEPENWLAYAPLLQLNSDGSVGPGLATSWHYFKTATGPKKGFELTLRQNARFSDGTPVTANAVVAWLKFFAGSTGPYTSYLGPNPVFQSVGKWTVRIRVTVPNPGIPFILAFYNWGFVASPRAIANPSLLASGTDGAGPYVLDASKTVVGDHITYKPNPYYYDKAAIKFSQVVVKTITDPSSMLQALETGQLDAGYGTANTASTAAKAGFQVIAAPANILRLVLASRDVKPLSDVRVRQALNYAINRPAIVNALMGKFGVPTSAIVTSDGADPKMQNHYPYDLQKAKSLLTAAGYPHGFTLKVLGFPPSAFDNQAILQAVAQNLAAIGVSLNITTPVSVADFVAKTPNKSFDMILHPSIILPMAQYFGINLLGTGNYNPRHVNDSLIDKLYYAGIKASNSKSYFVKITDRMTDQADFVPIATELGIVFASKHIGGVRVAAGTPGYSIPTEWFPK